MNLRRAADEFAVMLNHGLRKAISKIDVEAFEMKYSAIATDSRCQLYDLEKGCTISAITKRYKYMSMKYHPDKNRGLAPDQR